MSQKESEWEKEFYERFDDMNRRCDGEYGTGQFPPEVKRFFIDSIATAVSNREKEIAEEVEKMKKLPYESSYCQSRNGIYYCGTCEQTWEMCSCSARNTGHKRAIDDVIRILKHRQQESHT